MSNVYVCVRIRPLIKRELLNGEVPVVESTGTRYSSGSP